ncbi:class I SAM-dependent methyltransferase [Paenibacillus mendelii]|uniref:Class I SAM-dependent methyltransferase n=1 Tax=Paenibacillus mendelii TaxID=206163 RepID=A0ABV6JHI7_9BACL|nr:class I SAM-dependent methyltransferase [Paenibacillus mendelii]MCQ6563817.1 class I SAM-dependent methyltransferase [Paenibacillus mendelii]
MKKMDNYSRILLNEQLLSCAAYYFCRDAGLGKRYAIDEPQLESIQYLRREGILNGTADQVVNRELGYACYEYYRQSVAPDEFDSLLLQEAEGREKVLDLCCGPGATVHALLRSDSERIVYAVDHNPFYLSLLRSTLPSRYEQGGQVVVQDGDAHHVELKDRTLDFIVCRTSLQYLHIPSAIAEMYRLLQHGGKVFLVVHGLGYLPDYFLARKQLGKITQRSRGAGGVSALKFLTFGSLKQKLENAGFTSIQYIESSPWMFAGWLPIYFGVSAERSRGN